VKVGDLIKLPFNGGVALAITIVNSKPYMSHHPSQDVMVMHNGVDGWWDAAACELINEISS
jgi:predicted glutamine amidotransferase